MKIIDWINGKYLKLETMEIEERDDLVIIPAWQFALFVQKYNERGQSLLMFFLLFLFVVGYFVLYPLL